MKPVKLFDTTLRDGAQTEGISFTVEDKIKIAKLLDNLGIHYIEGGWPGSNPKDIEFFKKSQIFEAQEREDRRVRKHETSEPETRRRPEP